MSRGEAITAPILEFTAVGKARAISQQIAEYAQSRHSLSALVVPWESEEARLTMAVTSIRSDGWAIEHTNVGTIALIELGEDRTRVAVLPHEIDHPEKNGLATLLERFARDIALALGEPGT